MGVVPRIFVQIVSPSVYNLLFAACDGAKRPQRRLVPSTWAQKSK